MIATVVVVITTIRASIIPHQPITIHKSIPIHHSTPTPTISIIPHHLLLPNQHTHRLLQTSPEAFHNNRLRGRHRHLVHHHRGRVARSKRRHLRSLMLPNGVLQQHVHRVIRLHVKSVGSQPSPTASIPRTRRRNCSWWRSSDSSSPRGSIPHPPQRSQQFASRSACPPTPEKPTDTSIRSAPAQAQNPLREIPAGNPPSSVRKSEVRQSRIRSHCLRLRWRGSFAGTNARVLFFPPTDP